MEETPKLSEPGKGPIVFLILSSLMMVLAVLSYVFEDVLFDFRNSSDTFVYAITIAVMLALFFLYCYRVPRIGLWILGRSIEIEREADKSGKVRSATYDIFHVETATEEKMQHRRRKQSRHLRRRLAREAREAKEAGEAEAAKEHAKTDAITKTAEESGEDSG